MVTLEEIEHHHRTKGKTGLRALIQKYVVQEHLEYNKSTKTGIRTDIGGKDGRTAEDIYNDLMRYVQNNAPAAKSSPGAVTPPVASANSQKFRKQGTNKDDKKVVKKKLVFEDTEDDSSSQASSIEEGGDDDERNWEMMEMDIGDEQEDVESDQSEAGPLVLLKDTQSGDELHDLLWKRGFKKQVHLKPHQIEGVKWMLKQEALRGGGILADDMGLGKTLQTLCMVLLNSAPKKRPTLIVCPKSLLESWENESKKFFDPGVLQVLVWAGRNRPKKLFKRLAEKHHIVVLNYDTMKSDIGTIQIKLPLTKIDLINSVSWLRIILDEAQAIKNQKKGHTIVKVNAIACSIKADRKWCLTGTPLENKLSDLMSLFQFIGSPYGDPDWFEENFDLEDADLIKEVLQQTMLRRTKFGVAAKAEVAGEIVLPQAYEKIIELELSPQEQEFYERLINNELTGEPVKSILVKFLRGRQAANGIDAVDPDWEPEKPHTASTKLKALMQKIHELRTAPKKDKLIHVSKQLPDLQTVRREVEHVPEVPRNGKFVIFSQFIPMLQIIKETLKENNIDYCYIDGDSEDRKEQIEEFYKNPKKVAFVISLKAGGCGINLQNANVAFLVDPWWNPAVEQQALDRIHRLGSPHKSVYLYKFATKKTIEEKVNNIKQSKYFLWEATIRLIEDLPLETTGEEEQEDSADTEDDE